MSRLHKFNESLPEDRTDGNEQRGTPLREQSE